MRFTFALVGIAAMAFAQAAHAAPVSVAPISFSPEFQAQLNDELGAREGDVLRRAVSQSVERALTARGATISAGAPITIEISIVDADPNRPTMQQIIDTPGLDPLASVSIGGATLHAVLRGADGQVLSEVNHRRYNTTLQDVRPPPTTWSEARLAIRQFADKIADAYVAHTR